MFSDRDLIAQGLAVFDADQAHACVDAIAATPCAQWGGIFRNVPVPECDHVLVGTLPAGTACTTATECATDFCGGFNLGSVCAEPPSTTLGASCDVMPCTTSLSCVASSSGGPPTCQYPPDGTPCVHDEDCASHFCNTDSSTGMMTCGPPATCNGI